MKVNLSEKEIFEAAANGTLMSSQPGALPAVYAPNGDIYQAEGYRLLTDAEHTYLRLIGGKFESFVAQFKDSTAYEVFAHPMPVDGAPEVFPVGTREGQLIGDGLFYDLWGNVFEMSHDLFRFNLPSGTDPVAMQKVSSSIGAVVAWGPGSPLKNSQRELLSKTSSARKSIRIGRTLHAK